MNNRIHALACAAGLLLAACGGDDETRSISMAVSFPSDGARTTTNSLHFWVLEARPPRVEGEEPLACSDLRLKLAEPYDLRLGRLADLVLILADDGDTATAEVEDTGGELMIYAEAVGFAGELLLNGCEALAGGEATVTLAAPRTYDCADPATENGAPCDDNQFCTVGETCQGGTCQGGGPRNCTHLADQCNAEACTEELGCHTTPVSTGRPCEDGLYCSVNDICMGGECVAGAERDCSAQDGECRLGVCNEAAQQCAPQIEDNGATCDDGDLCTTGDDCGAGQCDGTPVDCTIAADDCNAASCNPADGECVRTPINNAGACTTSCTVGGTCSAGECVGGTPQTPGTEGPAGNATCSDYIDNDCDGDLDADDANCQ